jgi:hypothetical protein
MTRNLPSFELGFVARHGAVTVVPMFAELPRVDYRIAARAISEGTFEIHEGERRTVGMLEARNRGTRRVLIVEGDHVLGAKQNRMLTSSALVGARSKVEVPASCVEQGRWQGPTEQFAGLAATMVPASLRRIAKQSVTASVLHRGPRVADQQRIWSTIADQQRRLSVSSATRALSQTFAERAPELEAVSTRLPYVGGAVGLAIGVGAELVSVDVFDHPDTCAHYWSRLIEGAALDCLSARPKDRAFGSLPEQLEQVLASARDGAWEAVAAVGEGEELRAAFAYGTGEQGAASVLRLDGRLVHFNAVTATGVSSPRTSRMRRDLPDELAQRYRIVDRIGVGGTKEVFRAQVIAGGADVAIARMPYVDEIQFDGEIVAIRQVEGTHVPRIIESFVDDDGDGYLVMERVEGPNLATLVGTGALPVADAAPILLAFARGLREIHDACVLHRDIKLENAMLSTAAGDLQLKIIDFGLSARSAASSTAVGVMRFGGTLPYMSREMLRGLPLDARTDVYAFGVCCFRMLAGDFPAPPKDHESEWDYLNRLAQLSHHDFTLLPPLPASVRQILTRMLDLEREHRPAMAEVVAVFERAFGDPPLRMPQGPRPTAPRTPHPRLTRVAAIEVALASPEHVIVTPCMQAPIVTLAPGDATTVTAYRGTDGKQRWTQQLPARLTAGLRADLDGDRMRELYLAGPGQFAVIGPSGKVKLQRALPSYTAEPTLFAIHDRERPRIVVDGRLVEPSTGNDLGVLPFTYQGNGSELVATDDRRGIVFNGFAVQAFRGAFGTAPAIVYHPGDDGFLVAHLEVARVATPRVQLAVYGPGGGCRHTLHVTDGQVVTGDRGEIERLLGKSTALFPASCSPLAVLGSDRTAVVIVPLLGADRTLPGVLAAFELPTGRLLWRTDLPGAGTSRAILADLDGDGRPELVVGDGSAIVAYDPWSGAAAEPLACRGLPVAFGDPFASGFAHLITVGPDGIELWRGPEWTPGTMQWSGARGDSWRTGTLRADGLPLGPL